MRPEIADFIRIIYDDYLDHPSVTNYENIRGLKNNLFFFNHKHKEAGIQENTTKINIFEAKFIANLVNYLL